MSTTSPERTIIIGEDIGTGTAKYIIEQILKINQYDDEQKKKVVDYKCDPVKLIVNSYGGSCYDGLSICSMIQNSVTPIHTYVYGYAMSMGFLIAVSGHKRFAAKMATYMYHSLSYFAGGFLKDHEMTQIEMKRLMKIYDDYTLSKTKLRQVELDDVKNRKDDWFIAADEGLKLGLFDEYV